MLPGFAFCFMTASYENDLSQYCIRCEDDKPLRDFAFISEASDRDPICNGCFGRLGKARNMAVKKKRGVAWNEPLNKVWLERWNELQGIGEGR